MNQNNIIMEKSNDLKLLNNKLKELEIKQENDRDIWESNNKDMINDNK